MITITDYENEATQEEPTRTLAITRSKGKPIIKEIGNEEENMEVNEWWKQHKVRMQTHKILEDELKKEQRKKLRLEEPNLERKERNLAPEEERKRERNPKRKNFSTT